MLAYELIYYFQSIKLYKLDLLFAIFHNQNIKDKLNFYLNK